MAVGGRDSPCRPKYHDGLNFVKQKLVEALQAEQELQLQPSGPGGAGAGVTARLGKPACCLSSDPKSPN